MLASNSRMVIGCLHLETEFSRPVPEHFHTRVGPLFAESLQAVGAPVLGLAWFDGRMEDVRSELDLEVKGIVQLGDLVDGTKYLFLADETEGAVLREGERVSGVA